MKQRLENALARRDKAEQNYLRVQGRLENAKQRLEEIHAECRALNIEPEKLAEAIKTLEDKLEADLSTLEAQVAEAEAGLAALPQQGD